MEKKHTFPAVIRKLREERGISQKHAAHQLGISQALLSHYEKGIRECKLDFLLKLSEYYEVSCDYLLGAPRIAKTKDAARLQPGRGTLSKNGKKYNVYSALHEQLVVNAVTKIFDALRASEHAKTADSAGKLISLVLYIIYRSHYKNSDSFMPESEFIGEQYAIALFSYILDMKKSSPKSVECPISNDSALKNLILNAERTITSVQPR